MKIRVLTSVAGIDFAYAPGQVVDDAPEERALDLLNAGHAEAVVEKPATKRQTRESKTKKQTRG